MQLRFGRVLAGEIEEPGSYSIRTVKILRELERDVAALFKKLCSVCVVFEVFVSPDNERVIVDVRVPSLGGDAGSNALRKYGLAFAQLNLLSEYELIISNYNSLQTYNLCILNKDNPIAYPFLYQGKYWALLPFPDWDNRSEFRLSGVVLSRVGRELLPITDQDPMPEYTEDLKKFFASQKLQMVEVPGPRPITLGGLV